MRHVTPERVASLGPLLAELRALDGLVEKRPAVFYRGSRAFLHFHEHGPRTYADVRLDGRDFARLPVTTERQRASLLRRVRRSLQQ